MRAPIRGWIDGQKEHGDAASWLQNFTPRGGRSLWSKINREKALALIEAGATRSAEREANVRDGSDLRLCADDLPVVLELEILVVNERGLTDAWTC